MSETKQKILGINTCFSNFEYDGLISDDFGSRTSFMDYDAVIIDSSYLAELYDEDGQSPFEGRRLLSKNASAEIRRDFQITKKQVAELLKQGKNVFVFIATNKNCYIHTGKIEYSGTGKNARGTDYVEIFNVFSFLPVDIKFTFVNGEKFSIICGQPYSSFFRAVKDYIYYDAYFEANANEILLAIPNTDKAISAVLEYENGKIVLLPYPFTEEQFDTENEWREFAQNYLDALFELNNYLRSSKNSYSLPMWTENIKILNEQDEEVKLEKALKKMQAIEEEIKQQEGIIKSIKEKKMLLSATGLALEEVVKETLREIGFVLSEAVPGRSDIIASYKDVSVVAEIKGVSKSAAEKHAAQLEKWVSQFIVENNKTPKPILIVNGYCDIPLKERKEEVFPNQMLRYCESRGHALITTSQLLCLYIDIKNNPMCAGERISELLTCVGKYQRYQNLECYMYLI